MLDRKDIGVCPDGVGPTHVANGMEGVGESSLQHYYVLDLGCKAREVTCGDCTFRAGLMGSIALGQRWCTRDGFKIDLGEGRGGLHLT